MDPGVKKVVRTEAADRHPLNAIPTPRGLLAAAPPAAEARTLPVTGRPRAHQNF